MLLPHVLAVITALAFDASVEVSARRRIYVHTRTVARVYTYCTDTTVATIYTCAKSLTLVPTRPATQPLE